MENRDGRQTGFAQYALVNRTPFCARRSMFGVDTYLFPAQLIMFALCWSVIIHKIFGRRIITSGVFNHRKIHLIPRILYDTTSIDIIIKQFNKR